MLSSISPDVFATYVQHAKRLDHGCVPQPFGLKGEARKSFHRAWSAWKESLCRPNGRAGSDEAVLQATQALAPHLDFEHAIWVPETGMECRWHSPMGMALAGLKVNTYLYTREEALPALTRLALESSAVEPVVSWETEGPTGTVALGLPALFLWALYQTNTPSWGPDKEKWTSVASVAERWKISEPCLSKALAEHGSMEKWQEWFGAHPQALDALLVLPNVSVELRTRRQVTMIQELVDWGCVGTPSAWEHFRDAVMQRQNLSPEVSEFLADEALGLYARVRSKRLDQTLPQPDARSAKPRF